MSVIIKIKQIYHNSTATDIREMDFILNFIVLYNFTTIFIFAMYNISAITMSSSIFRALVSSCAVIMYFREKLLGDSSEMKYIWYFILICIFGILPWGCMLYNFSLMWITHCILANILLFMLVSLRDFFIILVTGIISGILWVKCCDVLWYSDSIIHGDDEDLLSGISTLSMLMGISLLTYYRKMDLEMKLNSVRIFGGIIAHETLTPLAVIDTTMQIIKKEIIDIEEKLNSVKLIDDITVLIKTARQNISLILQNSQHLEKKYSNEQNSLRSIIKKSIAEYYMSSEQQNSISVHFHNDIIFTFPKVIMQGMIFNLIKNAFQHGGKDIKIDISIGDNKLIFSDNGTGIKKSHIKKIFKKFFCSKGYNLGMGLSFCKDAMTQVGGKIDCMSQENLNTTFILIFPNLPK